MEELAQKPLPKLDAASQKTDERKTYTKIFDQVHQDLIKVEETLDVFIRSDDNNSEDLAGIIKPLYGMKGIFLVVNRPYLGSAVEIIVKVWKQIIEEGKSSVSKEEIKNTIALLSGVSLFISAYKNENDAEAEEIYDNIIKRFTQLQNMVNSNKNAVESVEPEVQVEEVVEQVKEEVSEAVVTQSIEVKALEIKKEVVATGKNSFVESPEDADLAEVFLLEAEEVLENLVSGIAALEKNIAEKKYWKT